MRLINFGGLYLEGHSLRRIKPLLLLSYLALEGPQERRFLAELFWPQANDPMNSLSAALSRLRKAAPGTVAADELRAWATVSSDIGDFKAALATGVLDKALTLYQGPFLAAVYLPDWSVELEEWFYARREDLAAQLRQGMLKFAESLAAQGRFAELGHYAEAACELPAAPVFEPEDLTRLYLLLRAGKSLWANRIREEAAEYGIVLDVSVEEARRRLRQSLIGRELEQERLLSLAPGEWAWVRGAAGMGKTALLKSLNGNYLPGRFGLPYVTLEPLVGELIAEGASSILQALRHRSDLWLLDNWERIDPESQNLLKRLCELGCAARVVISSREQAAFTVDLALELNPLTPEMLSPYPGAWEKTHGLPSFVEAFVRGESLQDILKERLVALSAEARNVFLSLALLDKPGLALVRRALGLTATGMATALEQLLNLRLIEPSGQLRVRQAALAYLETQPKLRASLCLQLVRFLSDVEAFPLYQQTRSLWTAEDEARAMEAYLVWAKELLRRGFPQQAYQTLTEAPDSPAVTFLQARALERAGRYKEAFDKTSKLSATPEVQALCATLYRRLGQPEAAEQSAKAALNGEIAARAEALNTLASLASYRGEHQRAATDYRRAAALWLALGDKMRWVDAINNEAVARGWLGEDAEPLFREAIAAAGDNPMMQARVYINLGLSYERREAFAEAMDYYEQAADLAERSGVVATAARAWNNIASIWHRRDQLTEAQTAYRKALAFAEEAGETLMLAVVLASLADIDNDEAALEEALRLMRTAGHSHLAEHFRSWFDERRA